MIRRTFLGAGLIGAALAQAAHERGDHVTVWNRSAAKLAPLEALGLSIAQTPADACKDASLIHLALTSDGAVDEVLRAIEGATAPGAIVIDHSTTSPEGAAARAKRCADAGINFLHVPVFMSPQACLGATGIMVACGPLRAFQKAEASLAAMTGKVLYVGEAPHKAAAMKLIGNAMILTLLGGLSDAMTLGRNQGLTGTEVLGLFDSFDLRWVLGGRGKRMAEGRLQTQWSLNMARKDLGLMLDAAGEGARLAALPAIGARLDALIADGEGDRDVGVIARDAVDLAPDDT